MVLDDPFPFRVEVWSIHPKPGEKIDKDTPRKKKDAIVVHKKVPGQEERVASEMLVLAQEGELFEIWIRDKCRQPVAMTLLVDGINTLGRRRERLGKAWSWVLQPSEDPDKSRLYSVDGWHIPKHEKADPGNKADFEVRRFKFVDLSQSVAARQGYGESIGLITAAFYWPRGRTLGVGEGPEEQRELRTVEFEPGRLMGVLNIRYGDESSLQRSMKGG